MFLNQFLSERMKTYRRLIVFCAFLPFLVNGQVYERTGKSLGVVIHGATFTSINAEDNRYDLDPHYEFGVTAVRMYKPGLFYTAGYSRTLTNNIENRPLNLNGNYFHIGLGFDKFLFDLNTQRIGSICIFHKLGLIGSLNYGRYYNDLGQNDSFGEINVKLGVSYYTHYKSMSKKSKGKTIHWELLYYNGITPFYSLENQSIRRHGLTLNVRFMKHEVTDFLK